MHSALLISSYINPYNIYKITVNKVSFRNFALKKLTDNEKGINSSEVIISYRKIMQIGSL